MSAATATAQHRHPSKLPLRQLLLLSSATFLGVSTENLPIGLLPQIATRLSISTSEAGHLVTAYSSIVMLSALPLALWTQRIARRRLLVTSLLVYATSCWITAVATDYLSTIAARLAGGLAHAVLLSMIAGLAAALAPAHARGRATAIVFAGNASGLALGVPAGAAIGAVTGDRWVFAGLGAAALLIAAACARTIPIVPGVHDSSTGTLKHLLSNRGVLTLTSSTLLVMTGSFTLYTYITPFLSQGGLGAGAVSAVLLLNGSAGIVGTILIGRSVDTKPALSSATVIVTMALTLLLIALLANGPTVLVVPAVTIWGASYAALTVCLQTMVLRRAPECHHTAASALYVSAFNAGISAGALSGGLLADSGSWRSLALLAASLVAVGGVVLSHGVPHRRRNKHAMAIDGNPGHVTK
ncbi:MFS transporter [Kineococcus arenarius]|uniref:MFS transporter n=1 Tax=unclassified Kineococcus TaxID=2621656 RepID=UPI003D7C3D77